MVSSTVPRSSTPPRSQQRTYRWRYVEPDGPGRAPEKQEPRVGVVGAAGGDGSTAASICIHP